MWFDIIGYEGIYQINKNNGDVIKKTNKKLLKRTINKYGYESYNLRKNNKNKTFGVHKLLALNFISNPNNKPQVNHIDGNKRNNNLNNLEWVTISENHQHAYDIGIKKSVKGEEHGMAKLNKDQVLYIIKNRYKITQKKISEMFNVSIKTIEYIYYNDNAWKEIKQLGVSE